MVASRCGTQALGAPASVAVLHHLSCPKHVRSSQARDRSRVPALAGGWLTTGPAGERSGSLQALLSPAPWGRLFCSTLGLLSLRVCGGTSLLGDSMTTGEDHPAGSETQQGLGKRRHL